MMYLYFSFGAGLYIGMAIKDPSGFVGATAASLIRGFLLCFVFWPIGLLLKLIEIIIESPDANYLADKEFLHIQEIEKK